MASNHSPEAQGSPILVVTIATAGVLLLLEAIHHLPNIIAAVWPGVHSSSALLLVVFAVIFVLMLESRMTRVSKHGENGIQR